jgi:hypothetical protein
MIQTSLTGITNLPRQIGHHAARFLMFAEKSDGDAEQLSMKNIYSAQVIARMNRCCILACELQSISVTGIN